MIIWLASYPKSGNTWLRSLLASYYFSKDGDFNFSLLKNIDQFPSYDHFKDYNKVFTNPTDTTEFWLEEQEKINSDNKIKLFKTHNALCKIDGNSFTNSKNTLGAIYVVRDPRNVVLSYANFLNCSDEKSANIMIEELSRGGNLNLPRKEADRTKVWIGTWASNFNSWKPFKNQNRYLLVKYEELINKPEKTFLEILNFIHRLGKTELQINQIKLENTIRTTSFDNLQKLEKTVMVKQY